MQNQRLPKVDMAKEGHKRSRFNFSHDVNTTADFGTCQVAMAKLLIPGSKTNLNTESLTRLAPMVAPTFGRLKYKMWHQFVELQDICPQFNAMMAQQPIFSPSTQKTYIPDWVPRINISCLSAMCLTGSRVTVYLRESSSLTNFPFKYRSLRSDVSADCGLLQWLVDTAKITSPTYMKGCPITNDIHDSFTSVTSQHHVLSVSGYDTGSAGRRGICTNFTPSSTWNNSLSVPLGNVYNTSGSPNSHIDFGYIFDSNGKLINNPVSIEGADFLVDLDVNDQNGNLLPFTLAFRFSDFGKRLRKILIGCGYQLDMDNPSLVSLLPLFAYYKAYWNVFGLTQWQDWQQTACAKLIDLYNMPSPELEYCTADTNLTANPFGTLSMDLFVQFIKDLGDCFVTDSADFVSAHLPSTAVSPAPSDQDFIHVGSVSNIDSAGTIDGVPSSGPAQAYINAVNHDYLTEEYLKRMYKWTNRNTIIGRRIAELLKAQGLGRFVDECKSDFIGFTEDVVTISDVVSTADTLQNGSGAGLGDFGGKGVQYTKGKHFSFENDVFGYWMTIIAIVPESGYSQQFDPTLFDTTKFAFYNPVFDSMGYDASLKCVVQGASDWKRGNNALTYTFGFKPRYFEYKFAQNITNGDMSRRSTRSNYLPYFLDRFIVVNDSEFIPDSNQPEITYARRLFEANKLPIAGNVWRFPTKYPWLGNLDRIFARGSDVDDNGRHILPDDNDITDWQYYVLSHSDNFLIHNIFDMTCYAPMLAVEDSFETTEDDEKPDMSIGKA